MDLFGNPADRDPVSPFVQLLWDRGHAFEQELMGMETTTQSAETGHPADK
jgi:hypothetical protein